MLSYVKILLTGLQRDVAAACQSSKFKGDGNLRGSSAVYAAGEF